MSAKTLRRKSQRARSKELRETDTSSVLSDNSSLLSTSTSETGSRHSSGAKVSANPHGWTKVHVSNTSYNITNAGIKQFFEDCGRIEDEDIHWLHHPDTGNFKRAGIITFQSAAAAARAVEMHDWQYQKKVIKVEFARGQPKIKQLPTRYCVTAFVANLPGDVDEKDLRGFAQDCGFVEKIKFLGDRTSALVIFSSTAEVIKFVQQKHGLKLGDRNVRVDYSKSPLQTCRQYLRGQCGHGSQCKFFHPYGQEGSNPNAMPLKRRAENSTKEAKMKDEQKYAFRKNHQRFLASEVYQAQPLSAATMLAKSG